MRELPDGMPMTMARLRLNQAGYPVPWFVEWQGGVPDFRIVRAGAVHTAVQRNLCWICGVGMGKRQTFVLGPMCGVNRTASEPPAHPTCASWAAKACPFLATPSMRRRPIDPGRGEPPPGEMLLRNPGVALLWTTNRGSWGQFQATKGQPGVLFHIGEPARVEWLREGQPASREEVQAAIDSGLPRLAEVARQQDGGPEALAEALAALERLLPAA